MPMLVLVIDKIVVAVNPRHTILRQFIIKTELKVNLNQHIDLVLIKTTATVAAIEIESLLGTPLSQCGAVMRATMSFLFAQSKKLVVAVIP
jgi:hypothetical protein